jgi:hypothetical protein
MRKIYVAALVAVLGLIIIFLGRTPPANSHSAPPIVTNQNPAMAAIPDVPGTIDGAKNPELIPDHVAYSAIFRMLSNRHTKDEIDRVRAYVKQMGLGKQNCRQCPPGFGTADSDVDAFLSAAEEFHQRVQIIDKQALEINDRTSVNPSAEVIAQLRGLQRAKEATAKDVAASLPARLTPGAFQLVRQHINEYVKQRIKLVPPMIAADK